MSNKQSYTLPIILVGSLFLLWGLANNMTDTLLAAFKRIMSMTDTQTSLIQFAFYGAYFCFALPAALFIRRHSYKSGIILGLSLYAGGAILFYPAAQTASYGFYLFAIYVLAGGCSILETTANPYILSMGPKESATRRLNIVQAFNPIGSILGILLSQHFILAELSSTTAEERALMDPALLAQMQAHELGAVTGTYMTLGFVLLAIMVAMLCIKMPSGGDTDKNAKLTDAFRRLYRNKPYRRGVVAQFFYVGAQIGVWSFTIRLVMSELNMVEKDAATVYLVSIVGFCLMRFVFTWLMRYFQPSRLLLAAALLAAGSTAVVILGSGWTAIVALVLISAFMSLMFPTIYGIALEDVGDDTKIGASGLIQAILGGALLTPVQGWVSDHWGINASFVVPLVCFVVVFLYALSCRQPSKA